MEKVWCAGDFLRHDHEPPAMEPAVREELDDFVARRVAEGGVPSEF